MFAFHNRPCLNVSPVGIPMCTILFPVCPVKLVPWSTSSGHLQWKRGFSNPVNKANGGMKSWLSSGVYMCICVVRVLVCVYLYISSDANIHI